MNRETLDLHAYRRGAGTVAIFNSDTVKAEGTGIPLSQIAKEEGAPDIARNTGIVAGFCGAAGIPWEALESTLRKEIPRGLESNLAIARRAFSAVEPVPAARIAPLPRTGRSSLSSRGTRPPASASSRAGSRPTWPIR